MTCAGWYKVDTLLVVGCADVLARASVVGGEHFSAFIGGLLGLLLLRLLLLLAEVEVGVELVVEEAAPLEQAATRERIAVVVLVAAQALLLLIWY